MAERNVSDFDTIRERVDAMVKSASKRMAIQTDMQSAFDLTLDEGIVDPPAWILRTRDTQPADAVTWADDMLCASDPTLQFSIPDDAIEANVVLKTADSFKRLVWRLIPWLKEAQRPQTSAEQLAESMENQVRAILEQNDSRSQQLLKRLISHDAFLFDMVALKVADLRVLNLWRGESKSLEGQSPFVFRRCDPRTVLAEWDESGLSCAVERAPRKLRDVQTFYPDANYDAAEGLDDINGDVMLVEYWTRDETCAWIEHTIRADSEREPSDKETAKLVIVQAPKANPLKFVPFVVKMARGVYDDVQPLLKPGVDSKVFIRSGLFMTMAATESYKAAIGQYTESNVPQGERPLTHLDFTQPMVYGVPPGRELKPFLSPVSPDLYRMIQFLDQKSTQTTLPKTVAGDAPGGVTAAAGINLLVHGARMRLAPVEACGQQVFEELARMVFQYVRAYAEIDEQATALELYTRGGIEKIDPTQLPKWFSVKCLWQASLPQDKAAMINAAMMAWQGGRGIISKRTAQEWAGVEDLNAEQKRLDEEQAERIAPMLNAQMEQAQRQGAPSEQQQPPQGMSAQTLPPNVAAGLPIEQNPQATLPGGMEAQMSAQENANVMPKE